MKEAPPFPRPAQPDMRAAGVIGSSPAMARINARITSVARSNATAFITGESGTGKELAAQAIHAASPRAAGPFIALNCGAIPVDLLESEVFGHVRGAFTGAISDKPGAATLADGGTLFLDEVCEMAPALQTKLLRFLQTSMVQPVGALRPQKVDVRIVCATNRDPMEEVRRGHFRQDLFYRLYVVPLRLPPLRERGDDVIEIAESALSRFAAEEGRHYEPFDAEVHDLFRRLPWPGNVRQLLNVIRNVVVLHDGGRVTCDMLGDLIEGSEGLATTMLTQGASPLTAHPLPAAFSPTPSAAPGQPGLQRAEESKADLRVPSGLSLAQIERLVIEAAMARHAGSVPRAAQELQIAPSTLYRKIEGWRRAEAASGTPQP